MFFVLLISLATSEALTCKSDALQFNEKINLEELTRGNLTLIGGLNHPKNVEDSPFNVPLENSIRLNLQLFKHSDEKRKFDRLRFEFTCFNNKSKRSYTEFTKTYISGIEMESTFRYCSGFNILTMKETFIVFENNVLMFYTCGDFLTIFGPTQSSHDQKEIIDKMARTLLGSFGSKLLESQKITFVDFDQPLENCENLKVLCLRDPKE